MKSDKKNHLLTFELGKDNEELEVHADKEGLTGRLQEKFIDK